MKNIFKFKYATFVASLLMLVSCGEKPFVGPEDPDAKRDIYYTVADDSGFAGFSGNTVHLNTEAEWDDLLDQFCSYAKNGDKVTFCNTGIGHSKASKTSDKDTPTSITTSDREELKAWMRDMEKAGKTVNITYDDNTGTWSGRAYTNLGGQSGDYEAQSYSGVLTFVPVPVLDIPPIEGLAMALRTPANVTYIITVHGMMLWFESDTQDGVMRLLEGAPATLIGVADSHTDLEGNNFMSLDLEVPDDGVIEF